jgi:pimeloyl-ACP methyl ester carboxylesterase
MMSLTTAGTELRALATAALSMPLRLVRPAARFEPDAAHPTPVVFVHGFLGDRTNFLALGQSLEERGIRNFTSFAYTPRFDYQRLAAELGREIDRLCASTGIDEVDIVGHSLGGLVGRYLVDMGDRAPVRRLVTLGAPYYASVMPACELAIFAADDPLIPAPPPRRAERGRVVVVPACGHLGLLYHPSVHAAVGDFLAVPRQLRRLRAA